MANCLSDKKSLLVFEYLKEMSKFSNIKNSNGEKILQKTINNISFISDKSAVSLYLNHEKTLEKQNSPQLVFPFGLNNSQMSAVKTAFENQISIIQGPPGTGKTQTILNIISNLVLNDKTVLVVSNNNSATANIFEKLEDKNLDFIAANCTRDDNQNCVFYDTQKKILS